MSKHTIELTITPSTFETLGRDWRGRLLKRLQAGWWTRREAAQMGIYVPQPRDSKGRFMRMPERIRIIDPRGEPVEPGRRPTVEPSRQPDTAWALPTGTLGSMAQVGAWVGEVIDVLKVVNAGGPRWTLELHWRYLGVTARTKLPLPPPPPPGSGRWGDAWVYDFLQAVVATLDTLEKKKKKRGEAPVPPPKLRGYPILAPAIPTRIPALDGGWQELPPIVGLGGPLEILAGSQVWRRNA